MDEWCGLGRGHFPIAVLSDARPEIALLGPLLDDKRRAALRARLGNWLVWSCKIAIGIAAATIKNPPGAAPLGTAAPHEFPFIAFRTLDPQRDRTRVLALRIILAADKIAEASRAANQFPAIIWTFFADGNIGLQRLLRSAG